MIDDKGMLKAELSGDDLHPKAAGYAIMARWPRPASTRR